MKKRIILFVLPLVALVASCSLPECPDDSCTSITELEEYLPPEATRLFAADGSYLADLSPQRRIVVSIDEIPPIVRDAFIAVEDRRFYRHGGVDMRGFARAAVRDLMTLSFREGFSTITMQLARNLFPEALPQSKKLTRKLWEVRLAWRIEEEFSKSRILQMYLNQVYLGSGLYGVQAAAEGYFGKPVSDVTIAEAALLVALVRSPEGYNPRRRPLRAIQRRNLVLGVMEREGVITPKKAAEARAEPLRLVDRPRPTGPAPYFIAAVRRELHQRFGPDADILGLRVHTTLDPEMQGKARTALVEQIERIEAGEYGEYTHPKPDGEQMLPPDSAGSPYLQGMLVAMDPHTGSIQALVGGRDFAHSQFDRAMRARRQPGSAFKPILYAAAVASGLPVTTRIETSAVTVQDPAGGTWQPDDHVPETAAGLSMRQALAQSSNRAAVHLGRWLGADRVMAMANNLGISTPIPSVPSIFLGSAEVIPAELVAAYAPFGNGGYRVPPRLITRIEDSFGRILWEAPLQRERALDDGVAYLSLSMLQDVIETGTGRSVREASFWLPAAGKTGSTNDYKDAWFVGLTPDILAGVWIGFDDPKTILPEGFGGKLAAPAWANFMSKAHENRPFPTAWAPPPSLVRRRVDARDGGLATRHCPEADVRDEYFVPGTEPLDVCSLHPGNAAERLLRRIIRGIRGDP